MAYPPPTVTDFKNWFAADFQYGITDPATPTDRKVSDSDIQVQLDCAGRWLPQDLLPSQGQYTDAYLYLAAHYLSVRMQESASGPFGQASWLQQSKTVGDVSEAFSIPRNIQRNPHLAALCGTRYGARFVSMILPYCIGNVRIHEGATTY
jgi:hypothetical protein